MTASDYRTINWFKIDALTGGTNYINPGAHAWHCLMPSMGESAKTTRTKELKPSENRIGLHAWQSLRRDASRSMIVHSMLPHRPGLVSLVPGLLLAHADPGQPCTALARSPVYAHCRAAHQCAYSLFACLRKAPCVHAHGLPS